MKKIPQLIKKDIDDFVATHEFNEIGEEKWFKLAPYNNDYRDLDTFWGRKFTLSQVLTVAVGLDPVFQARPI